MLVTIHTKNFNVSDRLRAIIDKKMEKINKFFDDDVSCIIVCTKVGIMEKMEITITSGGHAFRAQEENRSMYNNIDVLLQKIERQIIKNKEKIQEYIRKDALDTKRYAYVSKKEQHKYVKPVIKKVKSFPIKILSDQEAELDLATLDHNFFMYGDEKTHGVKVMYRRLDGNVGVIEITNATIKKEPAPAKPKIKK